MCQQWFSVIGLFLDVIGFFLLVREWLWSIRLQGAEKVRERGGGKPRANERKHGWQGWIDQYNLRLRLFKIGALLIIAGFLFQVAGSWPGRLPFFAIRVC